MSARTEFAHTIVLTPQAHSSALVTMVTSLSIISTADHLVSCWSLRGRTRRYLIYTRWCIPHCRQLKIEANSQALVVPITCVFCIAEMDKVDNKSSLAPYMQLKSI